MASPIRDEEHNGKGKVTLGPGTEVIPRPRGKDVDQQMVIDLRRMLMGAGLSPDDAQPIEDERSRDHGHGQGALPRSGDPSATLSATLSAW